MKRITCFIGALGGGGAEHQLVNLSTMLKEKGYDVTIATFVDMPDFYSVPRDVHRIRLAEGRSSVRKFFSIFCYFLFLKTDCVISYTQRANLLCLIPLSLRRGITVISGERNMSRGKATRRERWLFNAFYKRTNYIVPNSITQAQYIIRTKPSLESKVVPIINYTDVNLYKLRPLPLDPSVFRIAIFARFQRQKNCHRFAEMLAKLKRNTPRRFVVDWYGRRVFDNPDAKAYFDEFIRILKANGIEDMLQIKDPVSNVADVISMYDAICLPSVLEGFSNSVSEGIASGRPMIVSDISDNKIMVHPGENGFLFNPFDISDMHNAFLSLLSTPNKELIRMGKRSREIAESLFLRESFINSYISLIESK